MSRVAQAAVWIVLVVGFYVGAAQGQEVGKVAESPVVKIFSLMHANAEEMQRIVGDLFKGLDSRQSAFTRARASTGITGLRTSADLRTNSLIIIGSQGDLGVIEALIMKLDVPPTEGVPAAGTVAELRDRVRRLERYVDLLRSARGDRTTQPERRRSSRVPVPPASASPAVEDRGTRLRIEARPLNGETMELISIVPAGKRVKRGDLLLAIDSTMCETAVKVQQLIVEQAQAALKQSEAAVENTQLQNETQMADAAVRTERAKAELVAFQGGTQPLELKILQKEIQESKRALDKLQVLVTAGRADSIGLEALKVDLDVAETKLHVFQKYTGPKTLKELENEIASAKRDSQLVHTRIAGELSASRAKHASQRAQFELADGRLQQMKEHLTKRNLFAPHDGVVAATGPLPLTKGSQVRERQVVLILVPDDDGS